MSSLPRLGTLRTCRKRRVVGITHILQCTANLPAPIGFVPLAIRSCYASRDPRRGNLAKPERGCDSRDADLIEARPTVSSRRPTTLIPTHEVDQGLQRSRQLPPAWVKQT